MQQQDKKVLLRISNLKQYFPLKKRGLFVKANDGISIDIYEGETFGLVGESGCGKSTLGRVLLQLYHQTDGKTMYYGRSIDDLAPEYVKQTINKVDKLREHLTELKKKSEATAAAAQQAEEAIEGLSEAARAEREHELFEKINERDNAKKEYEEAFLNIAQLFGGFLSVRNLTPVKEAYKKEYLLSAELFALNDKLKDLTLEQEDIEGDILLAKEEGKSYAHLETKLSTVKEKVAQQQQKADAKAAEMHSAYAELQAMRDQYKDDEEFQRLEAYRDTGIDLARLNYNEMRQLRKDIQLIFQDPYSSLNSRMTVGQIIGEGLLAHRFYKKNDEKMQKYVMKVMEECGLASYMLHRYPHQFSGGQRQRIGIARSLALNPKFVVCDEAVSALDVSIQSQIINLLQDLREQSNLTYMFISHDLSVVKYISDRIGVMYLGNIVELADSQQIFEKPMHPYTEALLTAIPTTDPDAEKHEGMLLEGDIPSPINPPKGCKFHTRCRYCTSVCTAVTPEFEEVEPGHFVACHHKLNIREG